MPNISGYTTTYHCVERHYPFLETIKSLLGFCDEVCIVDAGSMDGTIEVIRKLQIKESRIRFAVEPVDFTHPRWAIHMDGYLKAKSRALCTGEYCWQTDNDEVVGEWDFERIKKLPELLKEIFARYPVIFLPMIEFWGSFDRMRADFFSWKQRISINDKRITHGIPNEFKMVDAEGFEYPRPFDSDSCNYIYADTRESVPSAIPVQVSNYNMPPDEFEKFFNASLDLLPGVLHVSWLNLKRKIEHYRAFWPKFHASMYNLPKVDSPENNVMFEKSWSEVTDEDIQKKAEELKALGPRSFHTKINPGVKGATIPYKRPIPETLRLWADAVK